MSEVYFSNSNLLIRSMEVDDAKIIYDIFKGSFNKHHFSI